MQIRKKVVLVNGSRLMRGIFKRVIDRDEELQVVAEVDNFIKIPSVLRQAHADWMVLTLPPDKPIPKIIDKVLREQPELNCLIMATDGSCMRMRKIEAHETSLDEKSLDEILEILRKNELGKKPSEETNTYR